MSIEQFVEYELHLQDSSGNPVFHREKIREEILPRERDILAYFIKGDDRSRYYRVTKVIHHLDGVGVLPEIVARLLPIELTQPKCTAQFPKRRIDLTIPGYSEQSDYE